ncbi:MAG: AmmeMemoRadiSam system radical SAM enzyme [Methanobacteriota archaeon]|nr:MAG: AmmeMemoRadiSam system radical SAM enzyme [Euryarchaeota archaeon]
MNTSERVNHEARYYEQEGSKVRCLLCPHRCLIDEGKHGICGVREHRNGKLYSIIFGLASSIQPDPIEKKPLFHFMPGTTSISLGSVGCNLSCRHCQNYSISRASPSDVRLTSVSPDDVVRFAKETNALSVSWTYNEPIIWHEFTTATSAVVHDAGLKTNYVTNGYISEDPLRELKGVIDAMNIDVKSFRDEFYRRTCGGSLAPVLRTCELSSEMGIHVELTYLVIPGFNDSVKEIEEFSSWVHDSMHSSVPVHFSAFHPDHRMTDVPRTPIKTMLSAHNIAKKAGLDFVYIGNVPAGDKDNTYCPRCGTLAIRREGFAVTSLELNDNRCTKCGKSLNIVR